MSVLDLSHGFHEGIGADRYHVRVMGLINKGALDVIDRQSPYHYQHWVTAPPEPDTPALRFGRAFHCRVLEPDLFHRIYAEPTEHPYRRPSVRQINAKKPSPETVAAIRYWTEWEASHAGMVELEEGDMARLTGMYDAVMRHPLAGPAIANSAHEVVARWVDPDTGIECKAMFDCWMPEACLIPDLKSTKDASTGAFARSMAAFRYHVQDAHYSAAVKALTGEVADMPFIPVESMEPFAVGRPVRLGADSKRRGAEIRARAMDALAQCLATDNFHGYGDDVETVELPAYAFYD